MTAAGSSRYTQVIRLGYQQLHKASNTDSPNDAQHCIQMKFVFTVAIAAMSLPLITGSVGTVAANNQTSSTGLFAKHCASCHGKDGRAKTFKAKFNHARDLTDPLWQDEVSDERLFNSIMNGKKKMPAYRKKLTETQVDSLIAYVRTLAR